MKRYKKTLWMTVSFFSLLIFACVTINIYFPAEKVESVAGEIVNEIRNRKPDQEKDPLKNEKSGLFKKTLLAFACPYALADDALSISNPTIRALKQRMKTRYAQMRSYYQKGIFKEENNGYVSMGNTAGLGLKEKRNLKGLVKAENGDRKRLYGEIGKALKIDASQIDRIANIFAREWQKPVR
jgi:hypothetical protein